VLPREPPKSTRLSVLLFFEEIQNNEDIRGKKYSILSNKTESRS
jgi:hypothetical protein